MKISTVKLKNFKNFSDTTIHFNNKNVIIKGANGVGKTTIGEAILYAFTGMTYYGAIKQTALFINISAQEPEAYVEIVFNDHFDITHILRRTKTTSGDVIYLDNKKATQRDINNILGIEPGVFACVYNAEFFYSGLEDNERDKLIAKFADSVSYYDIFTQVFQEIYQNAVAQDVLYFKNNKYNPDILIEKHNVKITQANEFTRINKQFENVRSVLSQELLLYNTIKHQLEKCQEQLCSQQDALTQTQAVDQKLAEIENQIAAINKTISAYQVYCAQMQTYDVVLKNAQEKQKETEARLTEIRNEIQALLQTIPTDFQTEYNKLVAYKENLERQINEVQRRIISTPQIIEEQNSYTCPTCNSVITKDKVQEIIKNNNEAIAELQRLNAELASVTNAMNIITENANKLHILKEKEVTYSSWIPSIPPPPQPVEPPSPELLTQLQQLQDEQKSLLTFKYSISNIPSLQKEIETLTKNLAASSENIAGLKQQHDELYLLAECLRPSTGVPKRVIVEKIKTINSGLNKCSINIIPVESSSGAEQKYNIEIRYNGVPYTMLSHGERIMCNLEIAQFISQFVQKRYPMLVDNFESISQENAKTIIMNPYVSQFIFLLVSEDPSVVVQEA